MSLSPESMDKMITGLQQPAAFSYPAGDIQHLQTHISHVILAGDFAYKIKKPLDLGFLDFSTLERRRFCCDEELRLNHRLAPSLYLEVVPITGTPEAPRFGGEGEALEYAVKMRRFPQSSLMSGMEPTPELIDRIAEQAAAFHAGIPSAPQGSEFGTPETVFFPMQQNFDQIRGLIHDHADLHPLDGLEKWTQDQYAALKGKLAERNASGWIRECHGDMHLGNMALIDGEIAIFDGIEFNPSLRWIDTISEAAFFIMDLQQAGRHRLAQRFLDRYLQQSGDYDGLALLRFYQAYRALVRAKVTAFGLAHAKPEERHGVMDTFHRYVRLAQSYARTPATGLIITYGVSGSGKSHFTDVLLETLPAIRLRSDVERKRLFGLKADAASGSGLNDNIYSPDGTKATYGRLLKLAEDILACGYSVIVDATFLKQAQREPFGTLARQLGKPWLILSFEADESVLRERIKARTAQGGDASEADIAVLEAQLKSREALAEKECAFALHVDSTAADAVDVLENQCRSRIA